MLFSTLKESKISGLYLIMLSVGEKRPCWALLNPKYTGNPYTGTLANSEDSDEMQYIAAFHHPKIKTTFRDINTS